MAVPLRSPATTKDGLNGTQELEVFIRRRANELGLSLSEIARRASMSRQSLYDFWTRSGYPSLANIVGVAEALQVHPIQLLELQFPPLEREPTGLSAQRFRWVQDRARLATLLLDHMQEAVIGLDENGHIALLSRAAGELLQRAPEAVLGQPAQRILPERTVNRLLEQRGTSGTGPVHIETRRGQDGQPIRTQASTASLRVHDCTLVLAFMADVASCGRGQAPLPSVEHDPVTGFAHPASTLALLKWALQSAQTKAHSVAVLAFQIHNLDDLREGFGIHVTEHVLASVAERIRAQIRTTDRAGRYHDEAFIIIAGNTETEGALEMTRRIRTALEAPIDSTGFPIYLQIAAGITVYPEQNADASTLLEQAVTAATLLDCNEDAQRSVCNTGLSRAVAERIALVGDLREALREDALELHYQPIFELSAGAITGVEALLRWMHPKRGLLPTQEVIRTAEQAGLVEQLDQWVLERTLRDLRHWSAQGLKPPRTAINASARGLGRGALEPPTLLSTLRDLAIPPHTFEIEISERNLFDADGVTTPALEAVRKRGIGVTVDHFGTGFASLISLRHLPATRLKVDQALVRNLDHDPDQQALVKGITDLGQRFGFSLAAEGVETAAEAQHLRTSGFHEAQGHYFAAPVAADEVASWLCGPHV